MGCRNFVEGAVRFGFGAGEIALLKTNARGHRMQQGPVGARRDAAEGACDRGSRFAVQAGLSLPGRREHGRAEGLLHLAGQPPMFGDAFVAQQTAEIARHAGMQHDAKRWRRRAIDALAHQVVCEVMLAQQAGRLQLGHGLGTGPRGQLCAAGDLLDGARIAGHRDHRENAARGFRQAPNPTPHELFDTRRNLQF